MAAVFKRFLLVPLVGVLLASCWRSADIGAGAADGGDAETDTLQGISDPDTGGPSVYEWSQADAPTAEDLSGVYGFSSSDVFAVGENSTILRFDDASWSGMAYPADAPGSDLGGVWGASPEDVFAVGSNGAIVHYDGAAWAPMDSGTDVNLHDVCGRGPEDVYAVGDAGLLLAYDGATWAPIATGTDRNLFAAWCAPGTPVYASGHASDAFSSSVVLRYDGSVSPVAHPTADFLYALGGVAPDVAFIGTARQESGEPLRLEISRSAGGGPFEVVAAGEDLAIIDLWAVGEGELWGVGFVEETPDGVILHLADLSLEEPVVFPSVFVLRGVWRDPGDEQGTVFAVGDDGTIMHGVPSQGY